MANDQHNSSSEISSEVERLTRLYDFSELTKTSLLAESENKVFLVEDESCIKNYVVRVNSGRLKYHTTDQVKSEMMWLRALHKDTDINVPEVLPARDGSWVQDIFVSGLGKPLHAVVYSFLDGHEPSEDDLVAGFERLGEISAQMHSFSKGWTPPNDFQRPSWTADAIFNDDLNWGRWQNGVDVDGMVLALVSETEEVVRRRLGEFPTGIEHYGLIHADLRLANLLVDEESTAIIDFDDCGFGWFLFDLATALSFLEEREDVQDLIKSWLVGYRKVAQIPEGSDLIIPTLIMLRRIQLIGWLGYQQKYLEFARQIGHKFTSDSLGLARNYLNRFG